MLLGRQLAHYRVKAGLTQAQLAEKTNYSVEFISLVERGVNAPTLARLQKMANVIGVEVWRLLYPLPKSASGPKPRVRSKRQGRPRK